jgi:hypothetical protein
MPRTAIGPLSAATAQTVALFVAERIMRLRQIYVYCVTNITGGTQIQIKVGYAGGQELVTNVNVTALTAGSSQLLTLANAIIAAGNTVTFTITTDRVAGTFQVVPCWDSDV